jgi:hypothetical protein
VSFVKTQTEEASGGTSPNFWTLWLKLQQAITSLVKTSKSRTENQRFVGLCNQITDLSSDFIKFLMQIVKKSLHSQRF